jgi:hypothetical protein
MVGGGSVATAISPARGWGGVDKYRDYMSPPVCIITRITVITRFRDDWVRLLIRPLTKYTGWAIDLYFVLMCLSIMLV